MLKKPSRRAAAAVFVCCGAAWPRAGSAEEKAGEGGSQKLWALGGPFVSLNMCRRQQVTEVYLTLKQLPYSCLFFFL